MNSLSRVIVYICIFLTPSTFIYSMFKTKTLVGAKAHQRAYIRPPAINRLHKQVKGSALERFNLAHGLAILESETLPNLYDAAMRYTGAPEKMPLSLQLTGKMFHRVIEGGELTITKKITNVAAFITPEIMGILMGAIESGDLQKGRQEFTSDLLSAWETNVEVQAKLGRKGGKKYKETFPRETESFFDLVVAESAKNKDELYSLLLAFLYKKIHHQDPDDEFHEWMHFIISLNEYIPVFSNQDLDDMQRRILESSGSLSWVDKKIFEAKTTVMNFYTGSSERYIGFLTKNFPLVVSSIIEKNREQGVYPPMVISGSFGYKGQKKKQDCVETATREVILNLFYDPEQKNFDVSKYSGLSLDPSLKEYLGVCTPVNMNTVDMGQLFFDMVADRAGIKYEESNYEMDSVESNILAMLNILFGTHASDWENLGTILSESSNGLMQVECQMQVAKLNEVIITLSILDKKSEAQRIVELHVQPKHSYVSFPQRPKPDQSINIEYLLKNPDIINPQVRSILYLNPNVKVKIPDKQMKLAGPLLYYSWPAATQEEKVMVIKKIVENYSSDNDAIQYAYGLFKSFEPLRMRLLDNVDLLKAYCQDTDLKFIDRTKNDFLLEIGIWSLIPLLKEMSLGQARKLLSSIMSKDYFDSELVQNKDFLLELLKDNNGVLPYILENALYKADFIPQESKMALLEEIISGLRKANFIQKLHQENPIALDNLLDACSHLAKNDKNKKIICVLLLRQKVDAADMMFYESFYKKILPLYISLLDKNYSQNIQLLGDIRLHLDKNLEVYRMYDDAMNALQQRAIAERE
jgi:hypothetical protein